eukprot:Pgem_evm1s8505
MSEKNELEFELKTVTTTESKIMGLSNNGPIVSEIKIILNFLKKTIIEKFKLAKNFLNTVTLRYIAFISGICHLILCALAIAGLFGCRNNIYDKELFFLFCFVYVYDVIMALVTNRSYFF